LALSNFKDWLRTGHTPKKRKIGRSSYTPRYKARTIVEWLRHSKLHPGTSLADWCESRKDYVTTVRGWLREQQSIFEAFARGSRGRQYRKTQRTPKYPEIEEKLFAEFKVLQSSDFPCTPYWFKGQMTKLVREQHPQSTFVASDSWLYGPDRKSGFKKRFEISFRVRTQKKAFSKESRMATVRRHHYFLVYKMAVPKPSQISRHQLYGLFPGTHRFALDQVPLDFQRAGRRCAAMKGAVYIYWKTSKLDIEKRL